MTDATAAALPPKPGAEDLFEIYYAPSKVFDRRRGGEFGLPLVALVVVCAVLSFATMGLMQPIMDAEFNAGIAKSATKMTPEQIETARNVSSKITSFGLPLIYGIGAFILGTIAWIVAKLVGVKARYSVAVMIATFAWFPRLIEWVVTAAQLALMPDAGFNSRLALSIGVGRFLDGSHPSVATVVLGRIDLFTLWCTFLLGLGFKVAANATRNQAILIGALVWVVATLFPLYGVLKS